MTLAPWLPWREDPADPAHRTKLLDYAPFAAIMWSFFLQNDSIARNAVPIYNYILAPSQCDDVLKKFKATGFAHNGSSFASLAIAIQAYATYRNFPEFFLDSSKHLQQIDPNPATSIPRDHFAYAYIKPADVCTVCDGFSDSYGPMALLELYAAPQVTLTSRFHRSMSFMHVVRMMHLAFARHESDVRNRTDRWTNPEPWQKTLQDIFDDFFRTVGLPGKSGMPTLTCAYEDTGMQSGALFGSLVAWPFFPSSKEAKMAGFFTTMGESATEEAWGPLPTPSTDRERAPTVQLATVQEATGPMAEAATMPFIIPALWDIILDHLFAYTPDNDWMIGFNPHEQTLEGDGAQAFRHCREACRGFDDYMLRDMTRFTMKPTRYISTDQNIESTTEIEFEQREFSVRANTGTGMFSIRHLYHEFRRYSREYLRARRSLIRNEHVHDYLPTLKRHDPAIQYWVGQTEDPTERPDSPYFLSRDAVHNFQKQCRHKVWTFEAWASSLANSLAEWADRDQEDQNAPEGSE